ncbi:hypothetical protein MNAN1_000774 [Malassezia nana]|uniref:Uncharacterized protein n=1 Tax=Malassezia nana TaxID=180528 RepID=A0AAF0J2M3_9BASI|nr:hypothetical protein MNAN1_000774 [Malassezia nana]
MRTDTGLQERAPRSNQPSVRSEALLSARGSTDQEARGRWGIPRPAQELEDSYVPPPAESESGSDSVVPAMMPSEPGHEQATTNDMQSAVFQQFSGPYMTDHECVGSVQALFVASATDPSGSSIAYGIYGGPFSMLNAAQVLRGEDRAPSHMARRTPLHTAALVRRAELRGVIVALRQLSHIRQGRLCAHVCVSSAYVAKAWGTWIPQWEAHGWPGEETEARLRAQESPFPETPRRGRYQRYMDSPGQRSSGTSATDSSASTRRSTRRLVDEDLLRELAALRAELARLDTQGRARVYLYQIGSQHNPALIEAMHCVDGDAPPLEPEVPLQKLSLHNSPAAVPQQKAWKLEPMRVYGPVAPPVNENATMPSPLPDDAYLRSPTDRSPHLARAKSPLAPPSLGRPVSSWAGTPRSYTASPMADTTHSFSPHASPHTTGSPLPAFRSKPSPLVSQSASHKEPFDGLTPTIAAPDLPAASPPHAPLTMEALEEHNRHMGSDKPQSRSRRRARSTRSSVRSENAQSIVQRLTPRFLRREPKEAAAVKSPVLSERPMSPVPPSITPKPRLRTVASQPNLRVRKQEPAVSRQTQDMPPDQLPKRVGFSPAAPDLAQDQHAANLARRHEELTRREQELARREVEMMRIRFEMDRQKKQLEMIGTTPAAAPRIEERSDWLWDATLRRTPRLPAAPLPSEQPQSPQPRKKEWEAAPIADMQSLGAPKAPELPLSRGSQWVMYEERLPTSAASDTTSSRSENTSSLGLFVDKGFGQAAALPSSSPYARRTASNASSLQFIRGVGGNNHRASNTSTSESDSLFL